MTIPLLCVVRRATLAAAIGSALTASFAVTARTVGTGQMLVLDNENAATESFVVQPQGILRIINGSRVAGAQTDAGTIELDGSAVGGQVRGTNGALLVIRDSTIANTRQGARSNALVLSATNGVPGLNTPVQATVTRSTIAGGTYASSLDFNASLVATDSRLTAREAGSRGVGVFIGSLTLTEGSLAEGQLNGVQVSAIPEPLLDQDKGRFVTVDASTVRGMTGSAIQLDQLYASLNTDATIVLRHGAVLESGNGVAIGAMSGTHADVTIDASDIAGDVRLDGTATAHVALVNRGTLTGTVTGGATMDLDTGTTWTSTRDSDIAALALNGGSLAFQPSTDPTYRSTLVRGDLSGRGGVVVLTTTMNAGGPLANQHTDRLLIEGDVITTGPTDIEVMPRGVGADTDANGDGVVDAGEGISLVQVRGASRANAFTLRGGYVAAGAFQYTLHAFGPGQVDPAQGAIPGGTLAWDYRLGNRIVCEGDCKPVDPVTPPGDGGDPGTPVDPVDPGTPADPGTPEDPATPEDPGTPADPGTPEPPRERIAVVPQLPSYLSAPAALLTYGDMLSDGLHQRLGDIRQGASDAPLGGEVFARYLGGQLRYGSNRSFKDYGYDFDQQVNALQLGGSLIALDGDNGTLRAGWAVDHGTTRVTPQAADGDSSAKYRANGVSGWITWQHGSGFWVDGVVGGTRYRGDVGTDLRGADVGRVRARGWSMSVETGVPIAIGGDWTVEPRFQLKHQQLAFRDFTDADGLDISLGTAKQTTAVLGGRISRTAQPKFMPYASVDVSHSSNGDPMATVTSEAWNARDRFGSGKVGNAYTVAGGVVSQLGDHVQLYGEGNYRHFVGGYGMRGWAGNIGIRVSF